MIDLNTGLILQLTWVSLGIALHILSWLSIRNGRTSFFPTKPLLGIGFLCVFIPIIVLARQGYLLSYSVINFVLSAIVFTGGLLPHILAHFKPSGLAIYPSRSALYAAITVNSFGLSLCFYNSWLAHQLQNI